MFVSRPIAVSARQPCTRVCIRSRDHCYDNNDDSHRIKRIRMCSYYFHGMCNHNGPKKNRELVVVLNALDKNNC